MKWYRKGMFVCSNCHKLTDDIRPQIVSVGVCFKCGDKSLNDFAILRWKMISAYNKVRLTLDRIAFREMCRDIEQDIFFNIRPK